MHKLTIIGAVFLALSWAAAQEGPRAYRNLNFGDSFDTVANKIFEDDGFIGPDSLGSASSPREWLSWGMGVATRIGGDHYRVEFSFYDDKLYRIRFTSDGHTADYFHTQVVGLRDTLVRIVTSARGAPTVVNNVSFLDTSAGYVTRSHVWSTNAEGVAYYVGLGEERFHYFAVLSIEWTWLRELHDSVIAGEEEGAIQDSVDDF